MTLVSKPLVVLDSNALFDDPYVSRGQSARLIALARSSKIDLAISEVVLLELQRQQRRTVTGRIDHLQKAEAKIEDSLRTLQLDAEVYSVRLPDFTSLDVLGRHVHDSRLIGGSPPMAEWRRPVL